MALRLPRFVALKTYSDNNGKYVCYKENKDDVGTGGVVYADGESVFNHLAKIEVERSQKNYIHLRFCNPNRYWSSSPERGMVIKAQSKTTEDEPTAASCTLFEPHWVDGNPGVFYLSDVHSGDRVWVVKGTGALYVNKYPIPLNPWFPEISSNGYFTFVDWETLVKLPKHVAFKGDNGYYLRGIWQDGLTYQQFSSGDPNAESSGYEVLLMPDGHVRIKAKYNGRIWRRSPNWIWADSGEDAAADDRDLLFWPVKLDDGTIGLRNEGNYYFCKALSVDGKNNCLNATAPTINHEVKLMVKELVMNRKIYNIRYKMEDARIFNETPYVAGSSVLYNYGDEIATQGVEISYEDVKNYSFSRSVSLSAGVSTTIEASLLDIVDVSVEVSYEISGTLTWDEMEEKRTSVKASGSVPVPPRCKVVVTYVGTRGTCTVPFYYTQDDKNSTDGTFTPPIEMEDGVYTGINAYNFSFVVHKAEPL